MSTISGGAWDEAWADQVQAPLGTHSAALLGRRTFIQNKRAAARPKDLADIDALECGPADP
jgi:hypothetical protein